MSTMLFDLDNERRIQISEAILVFSDSKYLKVRAIGKLGVFYGFLTFIDGVFDLQELQVLDFRFLSNKSELEHLYRRTYQRISKKSFKAAFFSY